MWNHCIPSTKRIYIADRHAVVLRVTQDRGEGLRLPAVYWELQVGVHSGTQTPGSQIVVREKIQDDGEQAESETH